MKILRKFLARITCWGVPCKKISVSKMEVKIRTPVSVPGSIPEFSKWSSGINPRTSKMTFWEWSQNVFIFFWDWSQSQENGFLGSIPQPQKNCSGSNWIEYLSRSQNIILWALGSNRVLFWDQSQNKFLGSVPEHVKRALLAPAGGFRTDARALT